MDGQNYNIDLHSTSKRKRARHACEPCRKRKKKCDGQSPCQLCLDFEYECSYSDVSPGTLSSHANKRKPAISSPDISRDINHAGSANTTNNVTNGEHRLGQTDVSVLTFPEVLASSFDSEGKQPGKTPIYTLGLREETQVIRNTVLRSMIRLEDVLEYVKVFFATVHIWHDSLVEHDIEKHAVKYWQNVDLFEPAFEILMVFIIGLGSFFSWPSRFGQEEQLVAYGISWMDTISLCEADIQQNLFLAAACIERTVYYRATASPRKAWMASCAAVHLVESLGLHTEWNTSSLPDSREQPSEAVLGCRRRLFWLAKNVNTMISTEYGRSRVQITGVTCLPVERSPNHPAYAWHELCSLLPEDNYPTNEMLEKACIEFVGNLSRANGSFAYTRLIQGEMACLAYRRLLSIDATIPHRTKQHILMLGKNALEGTIELADNFMPWWKLIQTPFQFLCTLLSLDEEDSLSLVPQVLKTIAHVNRVFNTIRTKDAIEKAQMLIRFALHRKEKEMAHLKEALDVSGLSEDSWKDDVFGDLDFSWIDLMSGEFWGIDASFG